MFNLSCPHLLVDFMIDACLTFITKELNSYLKLRYDIMEDVAVLSALSNGDSNNGEKGIDKISVTIVKIEEEATLKNQTGNSFSSGKIIYSAPPVHLNLYILFSANYTNYDESLKFISGVISFFQAKNTFTRSNSPSIPVGIDKVILDMLSMEYQDISYMWGILGNKYLPSVVYKLRMLTLFSGNILQEVPAVSGVDVHNNKY